MGRLVSLARVVLKDKASPRKGTLGTGAIEGRASDAARIGAIDPPWSLSDRRVIGREGDIDPMQEWLWHPDPRTTARYAYVRVIPIARILDPKGESASEVPRTKKQPGKWLILLMKCFFGGGRESKPAPH